MAQHDLRSCLAEVFGVLHCHKKVCQRDICSTKQVLFYIPSLYLTKGLWPWHELFLSSNPPEDDMAVCVYIYLQYQETPTTSALVITSAQAGKQVCPKISRARRAWVYMTWILLCLSQSPYSCHLSCCGTSKWLPFLSSQWVIVPIACTLPRVTEVSTGDLSPGQARWTNQGEPDQIISSLDTFHDTWLKGKAILLLLAPEPNTWAAVASPMISCSQGIKRSCS